MIKYSYIKSTVSLSGLYYEITSDSTITSTLDHIDFNAPNNLDIYFDYTLTSGEYTTLTTLVSGHNGTYTAPPSYDIDNFINKHAPVVDSYTGISGSYDTIEMLAHRRDLYNDTDNPLYVAGHTPILGTSGTLQAHSNNITDINTAMSKNGWYTQYIKAWTYPNPLDLLIYYGWLNSFNSSVNGWSNESVAQDMAKYNYIVLGDGIQNPSHGDYSNTEVIIPRIKALNQNANIFGYVTANQVLSSFQTKVDQWETLEVDGIFIDEAGYDYGTTRSGLNERVDYVHGKTYANICFVNSWNIDHVIGTENDASYPNTTYNPDLEESNLTNSDWYLLESYPINTTSYTSTGGYESKSDWAARGIKAINRRYTYGINLAAVGVINNDNTDGQNLFNFGFVSSMMWNLEAFGTSDTAYGASSAAVKFWDRPPTENLGREWGISPSVQNDVSDNDIYWRFLDFGRLKLDFSDGSERGYIIRNTPPTPRRIKFSVGELTDGSTSAPDKASAGPITGWAFDDTVEESVYGSLEIPVLWKYGTDASATVKFFNDYSQTGAKKCQWNIDYQIISDGVTASGVSTTTVSGVYDLPSDAAADTAMYLEIPISHDDGANPFVRGDVMYFRLYRYTNPPSDMSNDAILTTIFFDFEEAQI